MNKKKIMFRCIYIKLTRLVALVACCMLLLLACSDNADEPAIPGLITLKVTLPRDEVYDMNSPGSRAGGNIPGALDEAKITSLKFFVYDNTGTFQTYTTNVGNSMWDAATQTLRITITQGIKKIYCIANWTDGGSGMATITNSMTIANLTSKMRTHTNFALSNPPVMTGLFEGYIAGNETAPVIISLRRQIARVALDFKLSDVLAVDTRADIRIKGVKFLRLPSASYIFPQSSVVSPGGITTWSRAEDVIASPSKLTGNAAHYTTRYYYLPEYAPTTAANATTMVINATYNGHPTYYRLPIDPSRSIGYPHTANVIERNHTYQYIITIEGRGSDTAPTTRSVATDDANITYKLQVK